MAVDFINEAEPNLMSDFMCDNIVLDVNLDEHIYPPRGDIFNQIAEDLGISAIPDDVLKKDVFKCYYRDIADNCDISEFLNIKQEPPSPNSSCDSQSYLDGWNILVNELSGPTDVLCTRLETPPSTPSQNSSDSSPPVSPSCPSFQTNESPIFLPANNVSQRLPNNNNNIIMSNHCQKPIEPKMQFSICPQATPLTVLSCTTTNAPTSAHLPINGTVSVISHVKQELDPVAIKRQLRMIKNRESANLSRKKKREYVQNLETELKLLGEAHQALKRENEQLITRVRDLEKENRILRQNQSPVSLKKATALFAIVFMITLNLGPLGGIFLSNKQRIDDIQTVIATHHGRSLLWAVEGEDSESLNDYISGDPKFNVTDTVGRNVTKPHSVCPMYINKTESLRLENELRGWVFRSEEDEKLTFSKPIKKNLPPTLRLKSYLKGYPDRRAYNHIDVTKTADSKGLQLYESVPQTYNGFLKAIKHRDDTFYVVSFTGDHLLLPARAHNKTRRPLMSLILPALPLNDTVRPPKDRVAMMQIDCEVMNTKVVYVKESLIPAHLRRQNVTSFQPSPSPPPSKANESDKNV